jgi:hypothetical protein
MLFNCVNGKSQYNDIFGKSFVFNAKLLGVNKLSGVAGLKYAILNGKP